MRTKILSIVVLAMLLGSCTKQTLKQTGLTIQNEKAVTGTIYYIDPAGNDANDGTSTSTPWKTLEKVSGTTFLPGDAIYFKAGGTWNGQLWPKGSGDSNSPIIIDRYGEGNKPIINGNGTTNSASSGAVMLSDQDYWEINNLEISNNGTALSDRAGIGAYATSRKLNHIYVKNCYVHDVNSNVNGGKVTGGIIFNSSSTAGFNDVWVDSCTVYNVTKEGIRTAGGSSRINTNVRFTRNYIEKVYGDGIVIAAIASGGLAEYNTLKNVCITNTANYAGLWTYYSTGTVVQFNEVSNITGGSNDGEAFDSDLQCNGDIFQYNYSHDNKGGFILLMNDTRNTIIRYNLSVNDGNGTELIHYTNNKNTTNHFYNNTFYIGSGLSTTLFRDRDVTAIPAVNFTNNIIYVDGTVTAFSKDGFTTTSKFQNNCFYPASITSVRGPSGTVSGNNNSNALFVNAGLGTAEGFKLLPTSPLHAAGLVIAGNGGYDYFQTALPAGNPTIGFSEQ